MNPPDEVAYCTREMVQATVDQPDLYRLNKRIDDACRAGARELEGILHRRFYPMTGTRYPNPRRISGDTLWMNTIDDEVRSLTALTVDGVEFVEGTDYFLDRPVHGGPPYLAITLYRDSAAAWPLDVRDIVPAGDFGGPQAWDEVGTLGAAVASSSTTSMTVSDSSLVGVCDMVTVDSERLIIVDKSSATTTATVTATVDDDMAVTTIPVSSGALVHRGEMILIGSERMFVEDVVGNNLIVERALAGSVLAAHANADVVYAPRLCTVRRGVAGSTAVSHADASAVYRNRAPAIVVEANMALALNFLEQGKSAYARTAGAGDHRRSTGGAGVAAAISQAVESAYTAYGRQGRIGVA